jgi:hypothetical protein
VGADRRSDCRAGFDFEIVVTVGLCAVADFSECLSPDKRETGRRKQGPDFEFSGGIAFYKLDDVWEFQVVTGEVPNTVSGRSDQRR